ncbi:MAG: hypothetical protein ACRC5C_00850 [Bacilli bacterium]
MNYRSNISQGTLRKTLLLIWCIGIACVIAFFVYKHNEQHTWGEKLQYTRSKEEFQKQGYWNPLRKVVQLPNGEAILDGTVTDGNYLIVFAKSKRGVFPTEIEVNGQLPVEQVLAEDGEWTMMKYTLDEKNQTYFVNAGEQKVTLEHHKNMVPVKMFQTAKEKQSADGITVVPHSFEASLLGAVSTYEVTGDRMKDITGIHFAKGRPDGIGTAVVLGVKEEDYPTAKDVYHLAVTETARGVVVKRHILPSAFRQTNVKENVQIQVERWREGEVGRSRTFSPGQGVHSADGRLHLATKQRGNVTQITYLTEDDQRKKPVIVGDEVQFQSSASPSNIRYAPQHTPTTHSMMIKNPTQQDLTIVGLQQVEDGQKHFVWKFRVKK